MAKPKLGSGGRFKKMVKSGMAPALVAWIGDKKYGTHKMSKWANAGRKRHEQARRMHKALVKK